MILALRYWWRTAVCAVRGHDWIELKPEGWLVVELCRRCATSRKKP